MGSLKDPHTYYLLYQNKTLVVNIKKATRLFIATKHKPDARYNIHRFNNCNTISMCYNTYSELVSAPYLRLTKLLNNYSTEV